MRFMAYAVFLILALGSVHAQTGAAPAKPATAALPDGAGKPIVQKQCVMCHTLTVVTSKHASTAEWTQLVNQMVSRGAELTDDEIDTVVEYLVRNYGPLDKASPSAGSPADAAPPAAPETAATVAPAVAPAGGGSSAPVNVNKASADEMVSGLGFTKTEAEAVVRFRTAGGAFKTWKDVAAVPSGPSSDKVEKVQKQITF